MATEAQNRANAAYRKKNVKQVCIRFYPSEAPLLEYLDTKGGRASYRLITSQIDTASQNTAWPKMLRLVRKRPVGDKSTHRKAS